MKKILFSFCFFILMAAGAQAQKASCAKTCTKSAAACQSKAPSVATASTADHSEAAAKLASMDASIETRTNANTGTVSYVRKQTCSHSGTVSYVDLTYDAPSGTFVNASPSKMEGKGSGCGSKATTASGKAGCASGASAGKSCCAGKVASKSAEKVKS